MANMTYQERLIATASMYGKSVSEFEMGVWEAALKDYDDMKIARALEAHITDPDKGQFMPKVADIVRLIGGDTKDRANIAWSKAFNAISSVGQYEDVCFDDGIIHAVVEEMGGWVNFCLMTHDEISYNHHRFVELYKTNAKHGKAYPKLLVGVSSVQNRLTGQKVAPPVPIGNKEQCRLVYANGGGYRSHSSGNLIEQATKKITEKAQS